MTDKEWATIGAKFVHEFTRGHGDNFAWEIVRHDPRHVHVTIMARGHDGKLLADSRERIRSQEITSGIERDHGLERVSRERTRRREKSHDIQRSREGKSPTERALVQDRLDAALAAGATLETLHEFGIAARLNQATTGRISGISFTRTDTPDPYPFKGSDLGRQYSWKSLEHRLARTREHERDQEIGF